MLALIDAALVASLLVMVIISGYENFVSRFDNAEGELLVARQDRCRVFKIKVASTIVAISSIHLLQVFLNANSTPTTRLMWFHHHPHHLRHFGAVPGLYRQGHGGYEEVQGRRLTPLSF